MLNYEIQNFLKHQVVYKNSKRPKLTNNQLMNSKLIIHKICQNDNIFCYISEISLFSIISKYWKMNEISDI